MITWCVSSLSLFSLYRYITMMPKLRQALIEFENVEDAIKCVQECQVPNRVSISGSYLFFRHNNFLSWNAPYTSTIPLAKKSPGGNDALWVYTHTCTCIIHAYTCIYVCTISHKGIYCLSISFSYNNWPSFYWLYKGQCIYWLSVLVHPLPVSWMVSLAQSTLSIFSLWTTQ